MKTTLATRNRTLAISLMLGLIASPAMAHAAVPDGTRALPPISSAGGEDERPLLVTAVEIAKEVAEESAGSHAAAATLTPAAALQQQGAPKWKTIVGLALIGTGVGVIAKGVSVWQDEPDRFDRTKNADAYLAFGVGGTFVTFGTLMTIRGLKGEGFAH